MIQVFLDAGNFVQYSNFLANLALENNLLHVVVGRPQNTLEDETTSRNTLFAETTFISQAYAVYDLIKKYSWVNIGLIEDDSVNNSQMAQVLKSLISSPITIKDQLILTTDTTDSIAYRFQSTTRDSSARVLVVMAKPSIASQVLRAADQSVMGGIGYT